MTANVQPPTTPPPDPASTLPGLPTVQPPSGRHILQMFIVPGTIVASLIGVMLLFTYGCGAPRSASEYIKDLDSNTDDVRWRAADDLAKALPRDKKLAADADFGLKLADRLERAVQNNAATEKTVADRLANKAGDARAEEMKKLRGEAEFQKLERERTYIQYLTGALGTMSVPVGVPILRQLAEQESGLEPKVLARRRWDAIWALANLGERLQSKYDPKEQMPDISKDQIRSQLQKAIDRGERPEWARLALEHLEGRRAGKPTMMDIDQTAVRCTDPQLTDPFMRKLVALTLNFWEGSDDKQNERMNKLLLRLMGDTGDGIKLLIEIAEDDKEGMLPIQESAGVEVCYNAATALARRESLKNVPLLDQKRLLDMLADMLDESTLREKLKAQTKDDTARTADSAVYSTLTNALKAIGELHRKQPKMDLSSLRPAIDKLADKSDKSIKSEAKKLQEALDAK